MSDIVERGRDFANYRIGLSSDADLVYAMADEIERLRAELETAREHCTKWAEIAGEHGAEVDRLRAKVAELEEDAARYKVLRGDAPSHSLRWRIIEVRHWDGRWWEDRRNDVLDRIVDAIREHDAAFDAARQEG